MTHFSIDPADIARDSVLAEESARRGAGPELVARLRAGEALDDVSMATLLLSKDPSTEELIAIARSKRPVGPPQIETFSPLYITNECDGECLMCGMRSNNRALKRETADQATVEQQLDILQRRGIHAVAVLAGEYRRGARRDSMLKRAAAATRAALDRGFTHVLINVGSLDDDEYTEMLSGIPRNREGAIAPHVTMCTFQETYDPAVYGRFMGNTPDNPRCGYERRLQNFDRAAEAGMRSVNPGVLLGLNHDLAFELITLCAHVRHLTERGLQVYISLPRLRKASGAEHRRGVSDDDLARVVALLSTRFPAAKVVISTREAPEIQHRLLPIIGVLTAGSPGVAPYDEIGARFEIEASQFEVVDQRPFEEILGECLAVGATIDGYAPVQATSPSPAY
jgi:2-iminoacetate synthase